MRPWRAVASAAALAVAALGAGGCDIKSFIDPSEMFPDSKASLQKPILTSLSPIDPSIDDPDDEFYNAQDIQPQDREVLSRDYRIGKGDIVIVSVSGLQTEPGLETTSQSVVSESGNINLRLIPPVHAEGLTEAQLQTAVADAYRNANILSTAQVSVQVAEARGRAFSILGAVQGPGQYFIQKSDFRVLDALVLAHDTLPSVDTIYIVRQVREDPSAQPPVAPGGTAPAGVTPPPGGTSVPPTGPAVDPLAPRGDAGPMPGGITLLQTTAPAGPPAAAPAPAPAMSPAMAPAAPAPAPAAPFQFAAPSTASETRTIRVPLTALRAGALEYNIVIRPGDMILAPQPVVGEYYMGGHVTRTGVYSLSARKITLKQAIISAGMLDGLAIPQRTEIYRRIGAAREALVRVDIDAIFSGTQPDIFLKPNDVVQVGTNAMAPFIAAVRTGFRITYGFGFLYDRNYAPQQSF